MAPLPMKVTATGMPTGVGERPQTGRRPPSEHAVAGQDDGPVGAAMSAAADSTASSVGSGNQVRLGTRGRVQAPDSGGIWARFSGSSMCVGPGFSRPAIRNALRTISGMASMRSTRPFHLVMGRNSCTMSMSWWASLCSLSEPDLARQRDHRGTIEEGVGDARHEVGGARSQGGHGHGAATGEPAVDVGHERGALLVTGRDVADPGMVGERLQDVHGLLAGDREDVLAAFGVEAVDQQLGGGPDPSRGLARRRRSAWLMARV